MYSRNNFTLHSKTVKMCKTFSKWFNLASASMKRSAPLFENSYRPAVKK